MGAGGRAGGALALGQLLTACLLLPGALRSTSGSRASRTLSPLCRCLFRWADVIVPRGHVKFSTKNGKGVRLGAGAR